MPGARCPPGYDEDVTTRTRSAHAYASETENIDYDSSSFAVFLFAHKKQNNFDARPRHMIVMRVLKKVVSGTYYKAVRVGIVEDICYHEPSLVVGVSAGESHLPGAVILISSASKDGGRKRDGIGRRRREDEDWNWEKIADLQLPDIPEQGCLTLGEFSLSMPQQSGDRQGGVKAILRLSTTTGARGGAGVGLR